MEKLSQTYYEGALMNKDNMIEALRKSIDKCGIEIVNNKSRLKAILSDFLPGANNKFERKFLLDALEIDEWRILFETHDKEQAEHIRAVNVLLPLLRNYLGWSDEHSILCLDCYITAMGWNDVTVMKALSNTQSNLQPNPQTNFQSNVQPNIYPSIRTNAISQDDETRTLLEYVKQLMKNSGSQNVQSENRVLTPPPIDIPLIKSISTAPVIGSIIKFGSYDWRVLDVQGDNALLISNDITHVNIKYNETESEVTWENCTLRTWLNKDFLHTFSKEEKSQIVSTTNTNENNQWYHTPGGNRTLDKIFLLSISEVIEYFGDSGALEYRPKNNWMDRSISYAIDDQYNVERIANYHDLNAWWWLRSPGNLSWCASLVYADGIVDLMGISNFDGDFSSGGVRPALWVKLR
jgi:hypothetical protein